ncbi:MAG TPA: alpha/beta hydrolase [Thermoleophilaceae bacterium]|nr:alpha/beta hydrolase [Thermoleophilaceae bacterium]
MEARDFGLADSRGDDRTIAVNGGKLYYEEHGAGTPLVLIHAGLMSSATWAPLLPDLTDGFRVITPDSRGHGRSTNPGGVLSYAQIADDIASLIAALRLVRPVVGGYSDGGQIALELGARHPEAAGALIVGAAYPDFAGSGLREGVEAFLGADDTGTVDLEQLDATLGDAAGYLKSLHPGGDKQWRALVQQSASMWLDYEGLTADEVRRIEVPTLVFTGDRDDQISLDLMVSLYRSLPNAELAVWPDTDHYAPMSPERAGMFASMIRDFAGRHGKER